MYSTILAQPRICEKYLLLFNFRWNCHLNKKAVILEKVVLINSHGEMNEQKVLGYCKLWKIWATFHESFISTLFLFYSFYALNWFNHLASLEGDIVEITNDGPVEEILEDTEDISDYNIDKKTNRALFTKIIDNIVNDELESSLKRDIIWAINHLIQS